VIELNRVIGKGSHARVGSKLTASELLFGNNCNQLRREAFMNDTADDSDGPAAICRTSKSSSNNLV
jgi:hypothetical protein